MFKLDVSVTDLPAKLLRSCSTPTHSKGAHDMEEVLTSDVSIEEPEVDPFAEVREELAAEEATAADPVALDQALLGSMDNVSDGTEPDLPADDDTRRGRGGLEADVREITNAFVQGEITLPDGALMTPHRISALIESRLGAKASTGATSNVLKRWYDIGFCAVNEKPLAFIDYTDAARLEGLTALKAKAKAARKQARLEAAAAAAVPDETVAE